MNILTSNQLNPPPLPSPSLGILISSFTPGSHSLHLTGNYIYDFVCGCGCVCVCGIMVCDVLQSKRRK